jgi:hypothetical protein
MAALREPVGASVCSVLARITSQNGERSNASPKLVADPSRIIICRRRDRNAAKAFRDDFLCEARQF